MEKLHTVGSWNQKCSLHCVIKMHLPKQTNNPLPATILACMWNLCTTLSSIKKINW